MLCYNVYTKFHEVCITCSITQLGGGGGSRDHFFFFGHTTHCVNHRLTASPMCMWNHFRSDILLHLNVMEFSEFMY